LLYANPFIISNKNIILTLIPCFSKTAILQLKNQLKFIGISNINIDDEYKSLFEYPKYLKIYDYCNVDYTIFEWIFTISNLLYKRDKIQKNFNSIFHKLILYHGINIEEFIIDSELFIDSSFNFNFPNLKLTKLNSLKLNLHILIIKLKKNF
jgi:hypothetical protein